MIQASKPYSQIIAEADHRGAFYVNRKETVRGLISQHNRRKERIERKQAYREIVRIYREALAS